MRTVKSDVAEVKRDVKTLLASNASSLGIVAFLGRIAPWVALCVAGYAAVTR